MNEIIQIMKLMEQAPEFSVAISGIFVYLAIFYIKSKGRDEVLKIIKPINDRLKTIEEKLNIRSNGL